MQLVVSKLRERQWNSEWVTLKVYDLLGREVKTLLHERKAAGRYTVQWNDTDDAGLPAADGMCLYRLQTVNHSAVRKMLLG